jgi:polyhydroxyalkanoate synthesis regulator phasin
MQQGGDNHGQPRSRARVLERLDAMVASGRITQEEAARVRAAEESGEFDVAVREIRLRHARARLDQVVEDGRVTKAEADALRERLNKGDDPRIVRSLGRRAVSGDRGDADD